jgi:hypothetical protein
MLAMRSDMFRVMFFSATKMREQIEGRVPIPDTDGATLRHFMHILYTGVSHDLHVALATHATHAATHATLRQLYVLGDLYDAPRVTTLCETLLLATVNAHTIIPLLLLAHAYNNATIKSTLTSALARKSIDLSAVKNDVSYKTMSGEESRIVLDYLMGTHMRAADADSNASAAAEEYRRDHYKRRFVETFVPESKTSEAASADDDIVQPPTIFAAKSLRAMTATELRSELKRRRLDTDGSKPELVHRMLAAAS